MLPSPSELHYFLEVSNTLNVSRAAQRLGISQPTLSLAIQRLEHGFGAPLLLRGKSGVRLTLAGRKLVAQARQLLDQWEALRKDAMKDETEIRGSYVLGCHASVALFSLPSIIAKLLLLHDALELKLVHDLSRRITEDVISFKIDFGIVVNPWRHPELVIRTLCEDEVTLWASRKSSPLQSPDSGQAVLICDPDLLQTQAIQKQLGKRGLRFQRVVTSSSLEVIASLVASGAGVGVLPTRVATRIRSYGLRPLTPDGPKFSDRICLVYRADAQKSVASRRFAKLIEENLNPELTAI
jgi:DNA-binding transcriptional LysR family regulator